MACVTCGKEEHYARNCDQGSRNPGNFRFPRPRYLPKVPIRIRCERMSIHSGVEVSMRMYLEVHVDGNSVICLLDTGSEVTLIPGSLVKELPKKQVTS